MYCRNFSNRIKSMFSVNPVPSGGMRPVAHRSVLAGGAMLPLIRSTVPSKGLATNHPLTGADVGL